jgi:hypothetical protein
MAVRTIVVLWRWRRGWRREEGEDGGGVGERVVEGGGRGGRGGSRGVRSEGSGGSGGVEEWRSGGVEEWREWGDLHNGRHHTFFVVLYSRHVFETGSIRAEYCQGKALVGAEVARGMEDHCRGGHWLGYSSKHYLVV